MEIAKAFIGALPGQRNGLFSDLIGTLEMRKERRTKLRVGEEKKECERRRDSVRGG